MWTPSGSMSPEATNSIAWVEQPHSGWIRNSAFGCSSRVRAMSSGLIPAWTWHSPSQMWKRPRRSGSSTRPVSRSTKAPSHMSGPKRISGLGTVLGPDVADDVDRVGRGDAVVGLGLDLGRGVDVHDDDRAGMLGLPGPQLIGVDRVGERAAGVEVGDQDGLLGRENRGGLGHEVDAAEGDHLGVGLSRLAREAERVAAVVGEVLDLRQLVVVGEDDGVPFPRERANLVAELSDLLRASAPVRWSVG